MDDAEKHSQHTYVPLKFMDEWRNVWGGVKTYNAIPALQISRYSGKVVIGDNVTFNNYTDCSWNSKCKLWVCKGASLIIGNNSGMNGAMIYCENRIAIGSNVLIGGVREYMTRTFITLTILNAEVQKLTPYL